MSSMHAWLRRSLASFSKRTSRLFSRAMHSASTSKPRRSSKDSWARSEVFCWSVHAAAKASRRRARNLVKVGSVSISRSPSVVVLRSADVFVIQDRGGGRLRARPQGHTVEAVFQDRIDVAIGARSDGHAPCARSFEAGISVAFAEPKNAEAGAIALLGVRPIGKDRFGQCAGLWADLGGPVDDARRAPFHVLAMGSGHVLSDGGVTSPQVAAHVRGNALAVLEHLDGAVRHADLDVVAEMPMWHRVVVAVGLDVVIDVDLGVLPFAVDEALPRQGLEHRTVEPLEHLLAARSVDPHRSSIQILQQFPNALVERDQREMLLVA